MLDAQNWRSWSTPPPKTVWNFVIAQNVMRDVDECLRCVLRDHAGEGNKIMNLASSHAGRIATSHGAEGVIAFIRMPGPTTILVGWKSLSSASYNYPYELDCQIIVGCTDAQIVNVAS